MVRLDELPFVVIMKILESLSDPRDVDSVSKVCRLFHKFITKHPHNLAKFIADKVDVQLNYEQSAKATISMCAIGVTKDDRLKRWNKTMQIEEINTEELIRWTKNIKISRAATVELTIMSAEIRLASCLALLEVFASSNGRHCSLKAPQSVSFVHCKFDSCTVYDVIFLNNAFVQRGTRNVAYVFCEHHSSSIMGIFWSDIHLLNELRFTEHRLRISPTAFINCFVSAMMCRDRVCEVVFLDLSMPLYTIEYLAYKFCSAGRIDYTLPKLTVFMSITDRPSDSTIRRLLERALGRAQRERIELYGPSDRTHHRITVSVTPFPIGKFESIRFVIEVD